jgi:propionyl-CoA carboxylase beta chain
VGFNDSGGARIQEGVASLAAYADIGYLNVQLSGVVPQLSLILGPCAGGASYSPAVTDFIAMVEENSHMIVTGPDVISAVTGEQTTLDEIGGPDICAEVNGSCHYVGSDEDDAIDWIRTLLGYLPDNNLSEPPSYATSTADEITSADLELNDIVPDSEMHGYDMLDVLSRVVDDGELTQVQDRFAPNIICAFGRVDGHTVGVVANQPICHSGVIDINASEKGARFIRFCDAFNIPILTFVDVPGFMPGVAQERDGIVRRGPKLGVAYAEATVPMVTVVVRKAYGGGYALMGSKHFHIDLNLAWPTAEIAVMGATAAASLLGRRLFAKVPEEERGTRVKEFTDEYRENIATPYVAARLGYIDRVIEPSQTRLEIREALRRLRNKREFLPPKKHCTTPL